MSKLNERLLIQQEIALLKVKISDDRKLIQEQILNTMDQLNPFKNLKASVTSFVELNLTKLVASNPVINGLIKVCNKIQSLKF
jgi:hypothetical protein